jgi:hypothetical protein
MTVSVTVPLADDDRKRSDGILPGWIIVTLAGVTMVAVGAAVMVFQATGRDWWVLLRDPAAAFDFAPTAGLFSHLGVLAMAGMGAICVFAAVGMPRGVRDRGLLAMVGAFALWLALDDLFMLHEEIFPRVLGVQEHGTLGLYVMLVLGLMWRIGRRVFTRAWLGFWAAAAFLVVMLGTDLMFEVATPASFLVEEVAKLCGFVLWAAFWIAFAGRTLHQRA